MHKVKKYLFLFTIGPVQSFISQARKTQDLYAGSLLLSELIKSGIDKLSKEGITRDKVIFPYSFLGGDKKWEDLESLPNRFVALVESEETELKDLGKKIEKAVRGKWRAMATSVVVSQEMSTSKFSLQKGFFQQIEQHLDIHWLFEPYKEGDYEGSFERLERKMGAIKNLRTFEQYNYNGIGEKGRKCSLDGIRNVKFYRMTEKQKDVKTVQNNLLFATDNCVFDYDDKLDLSILQPGEGLSAVSFVKRCFLYNNEEDKRKFPSTAEIALMDWLELFKKENGEDKDELKAYKTLDKNYNPKKDNFNMQLLFEDNLNDDYLKNQGIKIDIEKAKKQLASLIKKGKDNDITQSKYYAIIAFDGDSMGRWLSCAKSEDQHRNFSELLIRFAQKAKKYLDGKGEDKIQKGKTVYAGGDDFLGFINLKYLFKVLIWLRDEFRNEVTNKVELKPKNEDEEFTFSAGIAIAHYKEPLSIVLAKAKAMEEKAKDWRDDKNAFAISVIKGSGEEHETAWGFEEESLEHIQYLVDVLQQDVFSTTFISNIQLEFARLIYVDDRADSFEDLLRTEFKRLAKRSLNVGKDPSHVNNLIEEVWNGLYHKHLDSNIRNFLELLNTAMFLKRNINSIKQKETVNEH